MEEENFLIIMNPENQISTLNRLAQAEKQIAWEQKMAEVNEIADQLGKGIDEKIKEPVAAFLIHEFTTSGSCEGHMAQEGEDQHGLPYPWVEVYAPEPEGWEYSEEKKREWTVENFKQQQKMMRFLEEFYKERQTPFDARLVFDGVGAFGGFRVQSFGAKMAAILTPEEQKQKLELYQTEMYDFTKFLKNRHFSKE
ncbi:MAG: hypothetical protein A3C04_00180 [Candidatus Wildermuthbacteria bacterium RIFCSPHIGHO2_02_FULL_45_25]|uniref:Uncharacterized protein n=2 Tax=Bacteria candidate phyla TaxID=1783234 RepID=A0A1G2R1E7_9BACT|nr:MAG: hypothetical protein A2720_00500 [Candidatus Doudnabacteria bacterium RIFCSPHIGHO2_01_FULL_46_24]OHA65901.1 MAG: hypothetical protein A3C04_00180 [Candidatus Wildermuthbacteria bacterium RIFCSPHIGHO2_02_FULL_45_25]